LRASGSRRQGPHSIIPGDHDYIRTSMCEKTDGNDSGNLIDGGFEGGRLGHP
jgi:hypothetical protein